MRSGNPALSSSTFESFPYAASESRGVMTLQGTTIKTGVLLGLAVASAAVTWVLFVRQAPLTFPLMIGGAIGGLVLGLVTAFKKTWAPVTAPLYAIAEGLFLGGISAFYETNAQIGYQGIVFQAVCLTFGTMLILLTAYQSGVIKPTENFKLGVAAATGGIMLVYLVGWVMRMFGSGIPFIHESGWIGIGFSLFVVVIAALNLVLDFDFIEEGAARGAPKYMEWYGAFGLMVTLVWLYLEILRLLSKLNSRD
jgi:uncharacterized YccA/Bax inhibitor family protein